MKFELAAMGTEWGRQHLGRASVTLPGAELGKGTSAWSTALVLMASVCVGMLHGTLIYGFSSLLNKSAGVCALKITVSQHIPDYWSEW